MKVILILFLFFLCLINCEDIDVGNDFSCLTSSCFIEHDKFSLLYNKNRLKKCMHCAKGPHILLTEEELKNYNDCMGAEECEIHEKLTDFFKYTPELIDFSKCMKINCDIDFDKTPMRPYVKKYRNLAYLHQSLLKN